MHTDWTLVARFAGPVLGALVAFLLLRLSERKVKLVTYYGHVGVFHMQPPAQAEQPVPPRFPIHAHTVVIRNAGKKTANAVRVSHGILPPDFSIFPDVPYRVEDLPGGGRDIVIPQLIPGQQVTISYMYPPAILYGDVTKGIRSDETFAQVLNVLPTPQPPKWAAVVAVALVALGTLTLFYLLISFGIALWLRLRP